jgi:hypothetical protein
MQFPHLHFPFYLVKCFNCFTYHAFFLILSSIYILPSNDFFLLCIFNCKISLVFFFPFSRFYPLLFYGYSLKALRRGPLVYVCTNFLETFMATVGILVDALNLTSLHPY